VKSLFRKFNQKFFSIFYIFLIFVQNLFPLSILFASPAYAQESQVNIDVSSVKLFFNSNTNKLSFSVKADQNLDYVIEYSNGDINQAVQSMAQVADGVVKADVYLGSCSTTECSPDEFSSGKISFPSVGYEADFSYKNNQLWLIHNGLASIAKVSAGVTYVAPQNEQVKVTFIKLPAEAGSLSIREVELSEEQVSAIGAVSNVAYDISSSMENGSFAYDLKLPVPEGANDNAQVVYTEDLNDLNVSSVEESVVDNEVSVDGLDHFTVFVVVYNSTPSVTPETSYPSLGFQATQTSEFGDYVHLAGTARLLQKITVTMVTWAKFSDYTSDPRYNSSNWIHPITVNVYSSHLDENGIPDELLVTTTKSVTIPWRPAADPFCSDSRWKDSNGVCNNGFAFNAEFDLSGLNVILPDDVIVGIAYDTQSYGVSPIGVDGPYNSLNVAVPNNQSVNVGSDDNVNELFWNTSTKSWYTDGGAAGYKVFRKDDNWSPNGTVSFKIETLGDNTAPKIVVTSPIDESYAGVPTTISGTVSDLETGVASVSMHLYNKNTNTLIPGCTSLSATIDGGNWSLNINNGGTCNVSDGYYEVAAWAYDNAGNPGWASRTQFKIDSTAPSKPTGLKFLNSDGKYYQCGDISKRQVSVPMWDDNTESDFDHYEYSSFHPTGAQGLNETILYVPKLQNSWMPPTDGAYGFSVRSVDKAGNKSDWSLTGETLDGSCKIIYDSTSPEISIDLIKYPNGTTKTVFVTNYNTPVILGSLISPDIDSVVLNVNGHDYAANISSGWEATISDVLADGEYTMTVIATDKAGNSKSFEQKILIDTKAPTAKHTYYKDTKEITDPIAYGQFVNQFSFTGNYEDSDPSSGLYWDSFVIFQAQDNGTFAFSNNGKKSYCGWRKNPNLVNLSGTNFVLETPRSFSECTSELPDGEYYLAHHIYDSATRKDIPSINQFRDVLGLHFVIDTVKPTSAITSYELEDGGSVETTTFNGLIEGTAADTGSGIDHVLLSIKHEPFNDPASTMYWNGSNWVGTLVTFKAEGTNTWNYQLPETPEGIYTISSHAVDKAGNTEDTYTIKVVFDKTIPEVTVNIDPNPADGDNGWYRTLPTLKLSATDNYELGKIEYRWNNNSWSTYSAAIAPPTEGQNILYYRGTDKVGNVTETGIKEVKYDKTSPIDSALNIKVENITLDSAIGKWEKPTNNSDITRYVLSWRHESGDSSGVEVGADVFKQEMKNLYNGEWTFVVKAMDAAGNFKESSVKFIIDPVASTSTTTEGQVLGETTGGGSVIASLPRVPVQEELVVNEKETIEEEQNPAGQVLGAEDVNCKSTNTNLPWILLGLQFVGLLIAEVVLKGRKDNLRNIVITGISLLLIGTFYVLRDADCIKSGFIFNWFALPVVATSIVTRMLGYFFIEEIE